MKNSHEPFLLINNANQELKIILICLQLAIYRRECILIEN